ncbi:Arabinanase/levansucrase/invertase [Sodiomyces alkalinus F11]|uniref:Arabinanase/levansucrase/invertase n=1 Tax=Sodiomyces alkalinus (strain CBS 110278 / VKM F-3762 / F11) TaxID=1314773 RepID=A0A3N2PYI5_SODAK|nr:Arabinanase/levansucrase/invertase [Sodiomyces alkalinus F11]ROT39599.1 Arabinanase/levansucrase/invertase [Sodiomyces alkalinus F11]
MYSQFTGEGTENGEQVYMSVSNNNDPGSWTAVNGGQPVLVSNVGETGVRDPTIIRSPDGSTFYVIATDLWVYPRGWDVGDDYTTNGSKNIVVWESNDLVNWSEGRLAHVSPDNAGMTWAPDVIWHPEQGQYMVYWTTNLIGEGWFIMRSFTSDFQTFSPAEIYLTGAGMDCTIGHDAAGGLYQRICKNGADELIEQASAPSLDGPWNVVTGGIGSGTIPAGEGPLMFPDNNDASKWHLFIDDFTRGAGYVPFETNNIASGQWSPSSLSIGPGYRHGYVIGM